MRKTFFVSMILLMTFTFVSAEVVNTIAARVNDQIITDFDIQLVLIFSRGQDLNYSQVRDKMVDDLLIIASAKDREYEINDQEIDYNVDQSIANQRAQYGSDEVFEQAIRRDGLTMSTLKENYRKQIKNQYLKEMIIDDKIKKKISISTEEVEEFYNENKEQFKKAPAGYKVSTIYFSAIDLKAMQKIYRNIKRGKNPPKSVEVKEFKKLYLEYLTDEQKALLKGVRSGYTDFSLSDKGLTFYKVISFDPLTPHVKYYVIPNMKTDSSIKSVVQSAEEARASLDKGSDFQELKSREDPDPEKIFGDGEISIPKLSTMGFASQMQGLAEGDTVVVEGDLGAYLVRVDEFKEEEYHEIGNVYTRIYNEKYQEKYSKLLDELIEEARKDNYVKVYK